MFLSLLALQLRALVILLLLDKRQALLVKRPLFRGGLDYTLSLCGRLGAAAQPPRDFFVVYSLLIIEVVLHLAEHAHDLVGRVVLAQVKLQGLNDRFSEF